MLHYSFFSFHSSFILLFPFLTSPLLTNISYFPNPWSTFLSIILAPSPTLFCSPYSVLFPPFVFNSPAPPLKPFFLFILSFHIPILPSHTFSSVLQSNFSSSLLPLFSSLAYASYASCFSICSTRCPPRSWLLLSSCLPSSPVMNPCYHCSTPNKCHHGSAVQ